MVALFFFSLIVISVFWHFHWALFAPLFAGTMLIFIGKKMSPAKENIGGYHTVRDLIMGMQAQANKEWS